MGDSSVASARVRSGRPAVSVRDELRELTRQRLLSAAQVVFERDGYHRVTIGSITDEARVNRATFYHHFNDKPAVFVAVWEQNISDAPALWIDVGKALADGRRATLREALRKTFEWYERHGRILHPLAEAVSAEPALRELTQGLFRRYAGQMTDFLAVVPSAELARTKLRLQLLMMQVNQLAHRLIVDHASDIGEGVTQDQILDEVTDMWIAVLPAPATKDERRGR